MNSVNEHLKKKTIFQKKKNHIPKWILVNAAGKTLGRLASEISLLLRGKEINFFTPHIDQGNFVVVLNANQIFLSGKKEKQKLYYRNSQRPGSLKIETFQQLRNRIPSRVIEKAVKGMLPKGILGRIYYRRLYIYFNNTIKYKKEKAFSNQKLNFIDNNIKINI